MAIIDKIKDGLKSDFDTEISVNLAPKPSDGISLVDGAPDGPQRHEKSTAKFTSAVIRRRLINEGGNKPTKATGQRDAAATKQSNATPKAQTPNSSLPQQGDLSLEIKAATNRLNIKNKYVSAVEKDRENTLKYNDNLQIQHIQNELAFRKPIPINDTISLMIEPPLDALPTPWPAFLSSIACSLNVPEAALISGLLAAVYTATCGRFNIEVRKNHLEPFTEYFIVARRSGGKKSPTVQTFRPPLDKYIKQLQAEFDKKAPDKKLILKLYKKTERELFKTLTKGVTADDIFTMNIKLKEIEKALAPLKTTLRYSSSRPNLFNDFPTMKKLAQNMKQQNEFIAIFDAEPGIWKHRVRANDDMILLKGYTMEPFGNETATNGSVTMQYPCLTICSYIQPEVAFKLYSNEDLKDDGLLPRILPVFALSKPDTQVVLPQDINPDLMELYENKITSILEYCCKEEKYGQGN